MPLTRIKRANHSFYRTLLLRFAAVGVLAWVAIAQFGVSRTAMVEVLVGTLWIAGGTIGVGALCAVLWIGVRKLLQRDKAD